MNTEMDRFNDLLGPISPRREVSGPAGSVSFAEGVENSGGAAFGFTAQSRLQSRAPFGEKNTFEFSRPAPKPTTDFKAFGALPPRPAASPLTADDFPTPASVTAAAAAATATTAPTPMSTSVNNDPSTPSSVGLGSAAAVPLPAITPATATRTPASGVSAGAAPAPASGASWGDLLLWRDPVSTVLVFAAGVAAYFALGWALDGGASVTPTSALAYAALAHLGLNLLRYLCSARWHAAAMWDGSAATDAAAEQAVRLVRRAAALHDTYLSAKDPRVTLWVALGLWSLAWLGTTFTAHQLLVAAYLGAFTLPALYARRRAAADAALADLHDATLGRIDRAEMPRTARLGVLLAALAVLAVASTWAQLAIGALVAATYWRTTLAPADVEAIRTAAEPLTHEVTHSVRKVRARLSMALDDVRAMTTPRTAPRTAKRCQ